MALGGSAEFGRGIVDRRSLFACLVAGIGVVVGSGLLYLFHQLHAQHMLLRRLIRQVEVLEVEVERLKQVVGSSSIPSAQPKPSRSIADDDEYLTADEEDDEAEGASSQSLFFAKIDRLLDGSAEEQQRAQRILQEKADEDQFQNSSEFWWRLAKSTHFKASLAEAEGDQATFQELINKGFQYAEKGVGLNDDSASCHKWFAILCGSRSQFLGVKDKIQSGYVFKEHVDRAIRLDPTDSTSYYLLGRFCLEVSMLSWIERKVASTLFSAPPTSTPEEAMTYFAKSESLKPLMDNRLYMAKCFHALGNKEQALKWLHIAASMPPTTATDKACLQQVNKWRTKLE